MGGKSIVSSLGEPIEQAINKYIENNGEAIIKSMIFEELYNFSSSPFSEISQNLDLEQVNISQATTNLYINFVNTKVPSILNIIDISSIIENKIMEMDLLDLENLILSVMKNELTALVNLGALIGFILGIINIFF